MMYNMVVLLEKTFPVLAGGGGVSPPEKEGTGRTGGLHSQDIHRSRRNNTGIS